MNNWASESIRDSHHPRGQTWITLPHFLSQGSLLIFRFAFGLFSCFFLFFLLLSFKRENVLGRVYRKCFLVNSRFGGMWLRPLSLPLLWKIIQLLIAIIYLNTMPPTPEVGSLNFYLHRSPSSGLPCAVYHQVAWLSLSGDSAPYLWCCSTLGGVPAARCHRNRCRRNQPCSLGACIPHMIARRGLERHKDSRDKALLGSTHHSGGTGTSYLYLLSVSVPPASIASIPHSHQVLTNQCPNTDGVEPPFTRAFIHLFFQTAQRLLPPESLPFTPLWPFSLLMSVPLLCAHTVD